MSRHLLSFDIPSIHSYIFGTDRAQEIRGASALVDRLNRQVIPDLIQGAVEQSDKIYAHGGNGLLVVEATGEQLAQAKSRVVREVRKASGGALRVAVASEPWKRDPEFQRVLRRIIKRRIRERLQPPPPEFPEWTPFSRRCESCGLEVATCRESLAGERSTYVGRACYLRRKEWQGHRRDSTTPWGRLLERVLGFAPDGSPDDYRAQDFSEIADACTSRHDYLAVVYADGDALGNAVQRLETVEAYRRFAEGVDDAVFEATAQAIRTVRNEAPALIPKHPPIDVLLIGGDDVVTVLPADQAVAYALELSDNFARITEDTLDRKLTLSTAVAIARGSQPFRDLVERAEELLKEAKTVATPGDVAGFDFADVAQNHGQRIRDARGVQQRTPSGRKIAPVLRPWTSGQARNFLEHAMKIAAINKTLCASILDTTDAGPVLGSFELRRILGRLKRNPATTSEAEMVEAFLEEFGAGEKTTGWTTALDRAEAGATTWVTPLADLGELLPYVSRSQ